MLKRWIWSSIFSAGTIALAVAALRYGNGLAIALESSARSESVGHKAAGRLEHGKRLPTAGPNFVVYSRLGTLLGRNSVHSDVRAAILDAYRELERTQAGLTFVYGETGWPSGGRLRPHRTHQNGLSADFMVPVRSIAGAPRVLPTAPWRSFGYGVEFDSAGRAGELRIDFDAVAAHLAALERAAAQHGLAIEWSSSRQSCSANLHAPRVGAMSSIGCRSCRAGPGCATTSTTTSISDALAGSRS